MPTTVLSTKGQIVIPKEIRKRRGWRPGTRLEIREQGDQIVLQVAMRTPASSLEDLKGCANYEGPAKTLEELDEAIAAGVREMSKR